MSKRILNNILNLFGTDGATTTAEVAAQASRSLPWVLHVEDDGDFSAALKIRLESHGIVVVRAFDGIDGVRHAFKYPADAIILDIEMPNGGGEEVLRLLKENPQTRAIPIIVLTCRKDQAFKQRMLDMGAACYLTKPLNFPELHTELARHLDVLPMATSFDQLARAYPTSV